MTAVQSDTPCAGALAPTVRFRAGGWRGELVAGTPLHEWLMAGGRPDQIPMPKHTIVRDGSRSRCARVEHLEGGSPELPEPLFFKAYRRRPGAQAWAKRIVGWHLPSWVWRTSWRLVNAGVPVARPQGYLVPQPFSFGKTSYFWSQWIEGAKSAKTLARDPETRHIVAEDLRFAERSAEILAGLHNAGVYHRDMNWGNLLVEDSCDRIWLIDLDSAHRWTRNAQAATIRDLARFLMDAVQYGAPQSWRESFIDAYARRRVLSNQELSDRVQATMDEFYRRRSEKHLRKARRPANQARV